MKPWAFVDYDGTLGGFQESVDSPILVDSEAYEEVLSRVVEYVTAHCGYGGQEYREEQVRLNTNMCETRGFYDVNNWSNSCADAYTNLCAVRNWAVRPEITEHIVYLSGRIFTGYDYVPLPGAIEAIESLRSMFNVAIVTKGNLYVQNTKLCDSDFLRFADEVFVLGRKNTEEWEGIFSELSLTDERLEECWAIGDSVRGDINPPTERGLCAIHLMGTTWQFEHAEYSTPLKVWGANNIGMAVRLLEYKNAGTKLKMKAK